MLYDQLGDETERTTESLVKGGIGSWLSLEHKEIVNVREETRPIQKLNKVVGRLRASGEVGSLARCTGNWLEDTFSCYASYPQELATGVPVILWHWQEPFDVEPMSAKRHMLLLGSAAYLMPRANISYEFLPTLPPGGHWKELSQILSGLLTGTAREEELEQNGMWLLNSSDGPFKKRDPSKIIQVKAMIRIMYKQMLGEKEVILGSPLYVELKQ